MYVERDSRYLVERVQGWGHKWLSSGAKEVLIKAILQAIPTYAMHCFKLLVSVCEDIERECANFWWGTDNGKRRMHWHSWDFLCKPKVRGGLGFRKLVEFNRALLAKQFWRILRNSNSLVSRVLKGRYFKHVNVMKAGLGSNPSYIWRSLIWSREILSDDMLWRIENGNSVKIFTDKWVPSMLSFVGNTLVPWEHEATVSGLIKDGVWDEALINNNFNTYVAGEIRKIPLPTVDTEDAKFWRFNPKGRYTVRDGCRLQKGLFATPENQSDFPHERWWAFLWRLSLPPKVQVFWCSVAHDSIPTNLNLARHHVPVHATCDLCGFYADTTCHALFFCPVIKHWWSKSGFACTLKLAKGASTMDFCVWVQSQLSKNEFEEFAIQAWAAWKQKQNFLHGDRSKPLPEQITWTSAFLTIFQEASTLERVPAGQVERRFETKWKPPETNCLKLNVDASFNTNLNKFSVGGVVRDNQGRLLLAFGKQINQPLSVVHEELLAIREGVNLLYENNFRDVQVATDSLLEVQQSRLIRRILGTKVYAQWISDEDCRNRWFLTSLMCLDRLIE